MASYKIIFKGEICENSDRGKIDILLAKFFKIPVEKANQLFNGKAYSLKKGLDVDDAIAMQQKLLAIGVITRLIKEETLASDITYQQTEQQSQHVEPVINKANTNNNASDHSGAQEVDADQALSKGWQMRFRLLEKFHEEGSKLPVKERFLLQFNFFALVFGPFYYLFKGMKTKGVLLWAAILCIQGVLIIAQANGTQIKEGLYFVSTHVFPMLLANEDYYKHIHYKEKVWDMLPDFLTKPLINVPILLFSLLFTFGAVIYAEGGFETMVLEDFSGVWRGDTDGAMVMIDLTNEHNKSISVNGNLYLISNFKVDDSDEIISMQVSGNDGVKVTWTLRKFESEDGSFYINLTLPNGVQDDLSFVRE